ncbi:MAG: hypothetical protein DRO00_07825 [Thermoproteota archaeon]|nr:MAG: hypothetical protein DRO00_07825 [Candidatus Korarchaeota archaeon]
MPKEHRTSKSPNFSNRYTQPSTTPHLTPTQKRILEAIRKSDHPVTPKEIAFQTGIKYNTTRKYIYKLRKLGLIKRVRRGYYTSLDIPPPMGWQAPQNARFFKIPRVHDLFLSWTPPFHIRKHKSKEVKIGVVKVTVTLGTKRNKVSGVISVPDDHPGLDDAAYLLALDKFCSLVEKLTGVRPQLEDVIVKNYHLSGHVKVSETPAKELTVADFSGWFLRFYQKTDEVMRVEAYAGPTTADQIAVLLQGGLPAFQVVQSTALLVNEVRKGYEIQAKQGTLIINLLQTLLAKLGGAS